jgi:hypothetical protein
MCEPASHGPGVTVPAKTSETGAGQRETTEQVRKAVKGMTGLSAIPIFLWFPAVSSGAIRDCIMIRVANAISQSPNYLIRWSVKM